MKTKFIEFIGNPGSGKSTLGNIVASNLSKKTKVYNLSKRISNGKQGIKQLLKIYYLLRFLISRPILFVNLFLSILRTEQPSNKLSFKLSANIIYLISLIQMLNKSDYDYIILDQGIIQALWSIKYEAKKRFECSNILKLLPENYFLIFVEVEEDVLLERLKNRGENFSRFEKNNKSIDLKKSDNMFEELYKTFESPKGRFKNIDKVDEKLLLSIITNFSKVNS